MFNRLTDYENSNPDNISCSNIKAFSATFNKIQVYNSGVKCPLQKFWFYLNGGCVKIFEKSERKIKIAIMNDKFISYIDLLDQKINDILSDVTDKKLKYKKSYIKKNYFPHTLILDIKDPIIYDENLEKIDIKKFYNQNYDDTTVSILIELSDILIDNDVNEYWINYSVKQIKIDKNILLESIHDINNQTHDIISNISPPPPPPIALVLPLLSTSSTSSTLPKLDNKAISAVSNHNKNTKDTSFTVSVNDIAKQLELMKKKKSERDNIDCDTKMKQALVSINDEIKTFNINKNHLNDQFNKITLD